MLKKRVDALKMTAGPQNIAAQGRIAAGFELRLLGEFALVDPSGQIVSINSKKSRAMLAILALSPGQKMSRERIAGLLWGERGEEQSRNSLRQSLAMLRKDLGSVGNDLIHGMDEIVALQGDAITVDAVQVLDGANSDDIETLRAAAACCRGSLLANLNLREASFEDWLTHEMLRMTASMLRLHDNLAVQETGQARIAIAQRLVALDSLREASHRALMSAYADAGEKGLALKQYEKCRALLISELGVEPAKETQDLKSRIGAGETNTVNSVPGSEKQAVEPRHSTAISDNRHVIPPKPMASPVNGSIAVLPFVNMSGDPEQEFFTDGLTEDIITDLSNTPGFFVIAHNSTFAFKGKAVDVRQIAQDLGVKYVLEGSARRSERRLRINVQLSDAAEGGNHIWAERFDRDLVDIFDVQDEVARRVVHAIAGKLGTISMTERYRPTSLEAYDLCVRSRNRWALSKPANDEARSHLERAIALDPNYCEAYWQLANTLIFGWLVWGDPQEPNLRNALTLAERAVEIDPNDSTARSTLGCMLLYSRRWDEANLQYDVALQLNQNNADTYADVAYFHVMSGRTKEAVASVTRAMRLNPRPPGWYYWIAGTALVSNAQYEDAVAILQREETYRSASRRMLAAALALLGRTTEAHDEAKLFLATSPHWRISTWVEIQPFKNPQDIIFWIDAFRLAGLPE